MNRTKRLAFLLVAVALLAGAGRALSDVYRIVSPDGRITYSDHPPTDPTLRAAVVNRPAASGAVVLPPPLAAVGHLSSARAAGHSASAASVARLGASAAVTPVVVEALVGVLAREEMVQSLRDVCIQSVPVSAPAFESGAQAWRQRNAAVLAQAERVLADAFTPQRRAMIQADGHTRLLPILTPLGGASPAARSRWCEQAIEDLGKGVIDLQGASANTAVAAPVMDYGAR